MNRFYKGAFLIFLSTFGFGLMPVFVKYAYMGNINVPTLLLIRFTIAAIFLFIYAYFKLKRIEVTGRDIFNLFLLGGVCYTLQSTFYFSALKYISASLAALILYSYPVIVAILSFIFEREVLPPKGIASIGISLAGLVLAMGASIGQVNPYGILYTAGAAVVYSVYIILGNRVVRSLSPIVTTAFIMLFTAVGLLLSAIPAHSINLNFSAQTWIPILGLVFFSTILSSITFFQGLELLGSTRTSILSLMEPVFVVAFSAVFFHETLTIRQGIGGAAILAGAVLIVLTQKGKGRE